MAWTQSHITVLEAAIASGVLTVTYQDKRVTYQSLSEMRSLLAQMRAEVANASSSTSNGRVTLGATNRG